MLRTRGVWLALICGAAGGSLLAHFVAPADASRNSSGNYSLPTGNPVISGTTITSSWANNTLSDVSTELTASLDRNGRGAMLAPLQCSNGTAAAPSLTFGSDTDTGLYRIGANNPAIAAGGTKVQEWTTTTATIPIGLVVTQDTAAANGTTSIGNTTGSGVSGVGGTSSGTGVSGGGGSPNGVGVWGNGYTSGSGAGVRGEGGATGPGGLFSGGATSGNGVTASATAASGTGVAGTGHGAGSGVSGVGGGSNGTGVSGGGGATDGVGVWGDGTGSGAGVKGVGGGTGPGGLFLGAGNSNGLECDGAGSGNAIDVGDGFAKFSATDPLSTTGFSDTLTSMNIVKAWARISPNAASATTIAAGFNVTNPQESGSTIVIDFVTDFVAAPACVVTQESASADRLITITSATTSAVTLQGFDITGGVGLNLGAGTAILHVVCMGAN